MFRLGLEPPYWLTYTVQGELCQLTTLLLCQNLGFWHNFSCKVCRMRSVWIQNALCGDYALSSVSEYQRLRYFISVKFGRGDRWQILRVKLNIDIRTVLRGVHAFLYCLSVSLLTLMTIDTRYLHLTPFSKCEFNENRFGESHKFSLKA